MKYHILYLRTQEDIKGEYLMQDTHFAFLLLMTGGSCSGSPISINFFAQNKGRNTDTCSTCVLSSTMHMSNVLWVKMG